MSYIPNASDLTEPKESRTVESAALEFRTLKAGIPGQIAGIVAPFDAKVAAEAAARAAADALLQDQISNLAIEGSGDGTTGGFAFQHPAIVSISQAVLVGNNALSSGPMQINAGVSITVPAASAWTIV